VAFDTDTDVIVHLFFFVVFLLVIHFSWLLVRGPWSVDDRRIRGDLGKHFFKNKKIAETPGSGGRVRKHLIFQQ